MADNVNNVENQDVTPADLLIEEKKKIATTSYKKLSKNTKEGTKDDITRNDYTVRFIRRDSNSISNG